MEHPALIEEVAVFGSEALGSADRLRVAANTLGVMDRVPVACLDRTSKGEQHSLRRIEPLIQRALPEQHLGADEQLLRVEGLAEVVVRSGSEAAELRFPIARCREDDDRDEPMDGVGLELFAHRYAVEPRHVDVEKDEIRLLSRDRIERLDAIFCLAHVVAEIREATLEKLAVRLLVVNDQDFRPAGVDELFCHWLVKARWPGETSARAAARHRAGPARRSASRGTRQSPRTSLVRSPRGGQTR